MYAIVDCNSFYCSAERVFRPDLWQKPVVVLSNNDGCVISISDEAKKKGVTMTDPFFKVRDMLEKNNIEAFSSNYNLYGDMSKRVMDTLRHIVGEHNVEVYSVDEAFLNLQHIPAHLVTDLAFELRRTVEQWTGVAVSVGAAPTKVLSKMANRLAKKNKAQSQCVIVLNTPAAIADALGCTQVSDIWGIGRQYAIKLERFGIYDAWQLSQMPEEWVRKNIGGVTGVRLLKELKGEPAIDMEDELDEKKMIATTRMFGTPVTALRDIKEAVATYTSRAAEKLRRQQGAATVISVFVVPKEERKANEPFRHGPMKSLHTILPEATAVTSQLIKPAIHLAEKLYEKGRYYKKAGIMLSGIVPDQTIQGNLFVPRVQNNGRMLMSMMDNINFAMRDDVLKFAASGTSRNWKMRQEYRSPRYTTRWDELCEVN
ncbi:MAG TPA: Y-family DNA polymerase [Chitinophagaceae bacterium]|nr:Y-family DNA polymerase [Chitinophagaceae bacterium]